MKRLPHLPTGWLVAGLAVFIGCGQFLQNKSQPLAIKGALDLSQWDFDKDGPIDLSGEYEFYWQQLLTPASFYPTQPPEKSGFIKVPGYWNRYKLKGTKLPGTGYATYRLTVLLKDSISEKLAFKFLDMGTACTVFANGEKILSMGTVGLTLETTIPRYFPQVVDFAPDAKRIELIYQVANFHHHRGGAWEAIRLGTKEQIDKINERRLALDLILFGSILIMGLYHFTLFRLRKNEASLFFFSVFCLLIAIRLLTTDERYLLHVFPGMSWELLVKIEYLSIYLGVPVFAFFIYKFFSQDFHKPVIFFIVAVYFLLAGIVCLTPARIFTQTLFTFEMFTLGGLLYVLFMLILAAVRKREGAAVILFGFLFLSATVINDILDVDVIIQTGHFVQVGVFIFIFSHAYILSLRYAKTFMNIDLHRGELEKSNIQYQNELMERQRAEDALRRSEKHFRALIENASDIITIVNVDGTIRYESPSIERVVGYKPEELIGKYAFDFVHPDDSSQVLNIFNDALQNPGATRSAEFRFRHKDGSWRILESIGKNFVGDSGEASVVVNSRDITAQKRAEQTLKKYYQELEDRSAKLKSINAKLVQEIQERERAEIELKRSQEELRNLSAHLEYLREEERAMIAREIHDELGQVLSTLKMDLGTLENHLPKDKKNLFEITRSMAELIYLTIQRVKRISQELRPSVLDHLAFPQAVAWLIDEFTKKTGISCRLSINDEDNLKLTREVSNALFRVLQEALTNIIRHAEATEVIVALEKTDAHVVLEIQDNGKGITNQEMADPQSFGLIGMRERIYHLNGDIAIKSGLTQGTTIVCTIPKTHEAKT